ncbi:MAG: hypothetical protein E6R07_05955 [Nevskiaceae bacterium]|nr:MAG: hypothetical protein E6R07_05955 [Nevskiaceae bacterium]
MNHKIKLGTFALGLFALASVDANAQTTGAAASAGSQAATSFAGASFGSPLAFGADWGSAGIGVFAQTLSKSKAGTNGDGSAGVAFGLGDSDKYVGLETDVAIADLTTKNGNHFGDGGSLGFKLHTNLPDGAAFAVGVTGTGRWGTEKKSNRASVYAVGTKVFKVGSTSPHALVVNLGVGDESFQELDKTTGFGKSGANVFGSVAFYLTPQISVIADYTGRFLNAGISVAPFKTVPLTFAIGGVNLTNRYDTNPQLAASLGYGFSF